MHRNHHLLRVLVDSERGYNEQGKLYRSYGVQKILDQGSRGLMAKALVFGTSAVPLS
jgi:hypothetical protein